VGLIEGLPESLRDGAALADWRARPDRLAQLRAGIGEDVKSHRCTFRLRARVAEYRRLKPNDHAINGLHEALGAMPREITNTLGMSLVLVPCGTFWMGEPGHQQPVCIPQDFYIGAFTVTQGQWQTVMGSNPSWFSRGGRGAHRVQEIPDEELNQFPVECVSWDGTQEFLRRLNARERAGGLLYRLPTEAEWESAAAGSVRNRISKSCHDNISTGTRLVCAAARCAASSAWVCASCGARPNTSL
jgi:formylglycine-generating enzyme required for sulfatase activity